MFAQSLRTTVIMFLSMTVLLGFAYPGVVTGLSNAFFKEQAEGSLLQDGQGKVLGSSLIGQSFSDPKYFWGRLSATGPVPYNAAASSGSNLGAAVPNLESAVKARIEALKAVQPENNAPVPVDLVTASGSGLDPQISYVAADYQAARVARLRGMAVEQVRDLIGQYTEERQLGFLGEQRVNVLKLNLALDGISAK